MFLGVIAFLISSFGLIRMPDIYNRMHIGTKATTAGILLIILGAICFEPSWAFKLILLAIFILLTSPLSSSVIARASHNTNVPYLNPNDIDDYKKAKKC